MPEKSQNQRKDHPELPPLLLKVLAARCAIRVWPALTGLKRLEDQSHVGGWLNSICRLPGLSVIDQISRTGNHSAHLAADATSAANAAVDAASSHASHASCAADSAAASHASHAAAAAAADAAYAAYAAAYAAADAAAKAASEAQEADRSFAGKHFSNALQELPPLPAARLLASQPLWPERTGRWWTPVMDAWRKWTASLKRQDLAERYDRWMGQGMDFDEWLEWSAAGLRATLPPLPGENLAAASMLHRLAIHFPRTLHPLLARDPGACLAGIRKFLPETLSGPPAAEMPPHPLWAAWQIEIQLPHTRTAWDAALEKAEAPSGPAL